jgi:UDP-N-acetylglucosamine--N-acetylmuramyl-(pentapeptide) pyrophosphoryl-undecaprenol N-acetylglucosamine transferase
MLPVCRKLKERDPEIEIYCIGTTRGLERDLLENAGLFSQRFYLDSQGFRRSLSFYNIITLWKYLKNYFQSRKILKALRPDIVVGMGGYVSGAVLQAALSLKIRTAIHEQNSVYGLTNRHLKKKVDRILLAYDIERNERTRLVGNPRISEIYRRYKDRLGNDQERSVLVVGGSQGAARINDLILALKDEFFRAKIKVILITGQRYYKEKLEEISAIKDENFLIKSFVKDLAAYLLASRVVVTRCGATTISEIMALRKVCLFIPSPNVTDNHQEKNALEIVNREGALMIKEHELTKENLFAGIVRLLDDNKLRSRIINNLIMMSDVTSDEKFVRVLDEMMLLG